MRLLLLPTINFIPLEVLIKIPNNYTFIRNYNVAYTPLDFDLSRYSLTLITQSLPLARLFSCLKIILYVAVMALNIKA